MSLTLQVFAARNAGRAALMRAVPELDGSELHEENDWTWFVASALEIGADRLIAAMGAVPGPVLLASLYDFGCWTLRLQAEGRLPFEMCYEFSKLLLDEEDAAAAEIAPDIEPPRETLDAPAISLDSFFSPQRTETAEPAPGLEQFFLTPARLGMPVPDELQAELRREKKDDAVDSLLEWTADEILDALEDFNLPHDADQVDAILLGDEVSDGELETPEGNLPRFLTALGITEGWRELMEDAAGDDTGPLDELGEAIALREDLDHILQHSAKRPPQPLKGGPILLPVEDLDSLVRVAWFCSHMVGAVIGFELPAGVAPDVFPYALDWTPRGHGARTPLYPGDFLEFQEERDAMASVLNGLPEGSIISMWFGDDTYAVARQCYIGARVVGGWRIDASAPALKTAVLTEALELARTIQRAQPLQVRSQEEFDQACEVSLRTGSTEADLPQLDGLTVVGGEDERIELAVAIFRLRFAAQWDTAAVQEDEIREVEGYYEELDQFFDKMAVPHKPAVVAEGEGRKYFEPDFAKMDFNGNRNSALRAFQRCEDLARRAGYDFAGAILCSTHSFEYMRLYAARDQQSLLLEIGGQLGLLAREILTEFEHGMLITSSLARRASVPHRGVLVRNVDDPAIERLIQEHGEGIRRMLPAAGAIRPFGGTLPELAQAFERFLFRVEGAGVEPADASSDLPF